MVLNLQSNALKFSQSGGKVEIKCKLIRHEDNLKYIGHHQYFQAAPNGMIEITVSDTGSGIQEKDKEKLFKLFGFLETTKELNTKGIGLGLYISKEIVNKFGGDISFTSEWQVGTSFTICMALDEDISSENQVARYKNPELKIYPKVDIIRFYKSSEDENLTFRNESNFEQ